jgi:hypothetical protein
VQSALGSHVNEPLHLFEDVNCFYLISPLPPRHATAIYNGDVVALKNPPAFDKILIRRVVAMAGDDLVWGLLRLRASPAGLPW